MFLRKIENKIKYNRIISIENLKKSLNRLIARQNNLKYWSKRFSFKEFVKWNKILQVQGYSISKFNATQNRGEILNLILLEVLAYELRHLIEPELLPTSIGFRSFINPQTSLIQITKILKSNSWIATMNLTEKFTDLQSIWLTSTLQPLMDPQTFALFQVFTKTNYINIQQDFHRLSYLLNIVNFKEFTWSIMSPLLINIFFHNFDEFLEILKKDDKFNKPHFLRKKPTILLAPFALKLKPIRNKKKTIVNLRFVNQFFLSFSGSYKNAQENRAQLHGFFKSKYKFKHVPNLIFNQKEITFIGFTFLKDKTYSVTISEKQINFFLCEWHILRKRKEKVQPNSIKTLLIKTDHEILDYYSIILKRLFSFYESKQNDSNLNRILKLCRTSCTLTLAAKYKLKTSKQVFNKFNKRLMVQDKKTGKQKEIFLPNYFN